MKRNLLILSALAGLSAESVAQQAPGYAYPPQTYPQAGAAPQYQVPPGYRAPQGYAPPSYPQQGYAQPGQSEYVSPMEFLPTFGRKFGSMFRRIFYGDTPPSGYAQPPAGYGPAPQAGRLDQPPQGYAPQSSQQRQVYPQAQPGYPPRYETPPAPRSSTPAMPPTSRMNSGSSSPAPSKKSKSTTSKKGSSGSDSDAGRKYTPPSYTKPKVEEEPPSAPVSGTNTNPGLPGKLPGAKPAANEPTEIPKSGTNAAANSGSFLRGKKTGKEGRVISPYPPYRELDVGGLSSGSLALDPTTQKVFEVP